MVEVATKQNPYMFSGYRVVKFRVHATMEHEVFINLGLLKVDGFFE